jgi:uncharacterized protein YndB with AHSA1/START domain
MLEPVSDLVSVHEIAITRIYDAPREAVWRAWTEPAELARWWGKRGWTAQPDSIVMDVRPGGVFRVTTVSDLDGSEMTTNGIYREVEPPGRLMFIEPAEAGCAETDGAVGTVTLTDLGAGRTQMTFRTTLRTTAENRLRAEGGLTSAFDRLEEQLR